jgi:cytochrome c-type biogenesis protein CcmE
MRLIVIILALAAIAVGLIHLRRNEIAVRHDIQRVQIQRIELRRQVAEQEVRIGHLVAPHSVQRRVTLLEELRNRGWSDRLAARPEGDEARE